MSTDDSRRAPTTHSINATLKYADSYVGFSTALIFHTLLRPPSPLCLCHYVQVIVSYSFFK